jgi:hypothetical protein
MFQDLTWTFFVYFVFKAVTCFYDNQRWFNMFTKCRNWILSWARLIHFTNWQPWGIKIPSHIVLHLSLDLPAGISHISHMCYIPCPSHLTVKGRGFEALHCKFIHPLPPLCAIKCMLRGNNLYLYPLRSFTINLSNLFWNIIICLIGSLMTLY